MKNIITVIIIFTVLIGGCFFSAAYLSKTRHELERDLSAIQKLIDDDYKAAGHYLVSLENTLDKNKTQLAVFINHNLIENMELSLKFIKEFYLSGDRARLREHLHEMKFYVSQISDEHALNFENLL